MNFLWQMPGDSYYRLLQMKSRKAKPEFIMNKLLAWLKQPTSIHGIAGLAGIGTAAALIYIWHVPADAAGVAGGAVYSALLVALKDNTADPKTVEKFVMDAANAAVSHHLAEAAPVLVDDLSKLIFRPAAAPETHPALPAPVAGPIIVNPLPPVT